MLRPSIGARFHLISSGKDVKNTNRNPLSLDSNSLYQRRARPLLFPSGGWYQRPQAESGFDELDSAATPMMRYSGRSEALMGLGNARPPSSAMVMDKKLASGSQVSSSTRETQQVPIAILASTHDRFKGRAHSEKHSRASKDSTTKLESTLIRILIAEDHFIARAGVSAIVSAQQDMTVIAEATIGQQAVSLYREYRPDVVLMDLFMPMMSGFDATAAIRAEFPAARIIALSTYGGEEDIHHAFQSGVQAYLTKDVLHEELIQAIRVVHSGRKHLPPAIAAVLASQLDRTHLTDRELQVLQCIVEGSNNKQIAHALGIAEFTVKNHVRNILEKLGVEDRTQAVTVSIQRGIVHLR